METQTTLTPDQILFAKTAKLRPATRSRIIMRELLKRRLKSSSHSKLEKKTIRNRIFHFKAPK